MSLVEGGARRARAELGWAPTIDFPDFMRTMAGADLRHATRERDYADFRRQAPRYRGLVGVALAAGW